MEKCNYKCENDPVCVGFVFDTTALVCSHFDRLSTKLEKDSARFIGYKKKSMLNWA